MNTKKIMKPILQEDNILLQAAYADRWSAIRACGEVLVKQGYVTAAMWKICWNGNVWYLSM